VVRELAWQRRAQGLAAEHEPPAYLRQALGPVPESTRGRRAWRQAAAIEDYRRSHRVTDPDRARGPPPREPAQRTAWQQVREAIVRVQGLQRRPDHDREPQRDAASHPLPGRPRPAGPAASPLQGCAAAPVRPGAGCRLAPQGGHHGQAT
jgi:hypothetical protein